MAQQTVTYLFLILLVISLFIASYVVNQQIRKRKIADGISESDITLLGSIKRAPVFLFATVGGALTSLASVFLFFLLQSATFGWLTFLTLLAFPLGAVVAKRICHKALQRASTEPKFRRAIESGLMTAFHHESGSASVSRMIKYISMANVLAVFWLEAKVLTTALADGLLGLTPNSGNYFFLGLVCAIIVFILAKFVLSFGMNGVVLTDALYWPIIILASVMLIFTLIAQTLENPEVVSKISLEPMVGGWTLLAFAANIFFVNLVYIVARDDQWLRIAAYRNDHRLIENPAMSSIIRATIGAVPVWIILISCGFLASALSTEGPMTVNSILRLGDDAVLFTPLILLGMVAAMFSTSDNQLFALKRLLSYNTRTGLIRVFNLQFRNALILSLSIAVLFGSLTSLTFFFKIPDQQLVFFCLGLPAVMFPAIYAVIYTGKVRQMDVAVPLTVYVLIGAVGFEPGGGVNSWIVGAAPISGVTGFLLTFGCARLRGEKLD